MVVDHVIEKHLFSELVSSLNESSSISWILRIKSEKKKKKRRKMTSLEKKIKSHTRGVVLLSLSGEECLLKSRKRRHRYNFPDVKNTPLVEVPDANVKISAEICFKVFLFNPILFPFNHSGAV